MDQSAGFGLRIRNLILVFSLATALTLGLHLSANGEINTGIPIGGFSTAVDPTFTISANPSNLTIPVYSVASFTVTIQAYNFSGTLTWSLYGSDWPGNGPNCFLGPYQLTFDRSEPTATASVTCNPSSIGTYHMGVALCTSGCFYASPSNLITINVVDGSGIPEPDFDLNANSPGQVATNQSFAVIITITARNGFNGKVTLAGAFPGGLVCGLFKPLFVNSSGTATFSCSSRTPGAYTVAITGLAVCTSSTYYRECSHTARISVTVLADLLAPVYFYGGIGALVAVVETVTRSLYGRLRRTNTHVQLRPWLSIIRLPMLSSSLFHGRDC